MQKLKLILTDHLFYISLIILCGWFFHADIHTFIHNILVDQNLSSGVASTISHVLDILATAFAIAISPVLTHMLPVSKNNAA